MHSAFYRCILWANPGT